jgi:hypothetical protein
LTTRKLWRCRRWEKEMRIYFIHPSGISRVLLHVVQSYDMGPSGFNFPSERKLCCRFLSPLKNPSPWQGSTPQPLGPVASTLTTSPPRRHPVSGKTSGRHSQTDGYATAEVYMSPGTLSGQYVGVCDLCFALHTWNCI